MASYRTAANTYAIQSMGFGPTGELSNVANTVSGPPVAQFGPVDFGGATMQRSVVLPPDFASWDPELFIPEVAVSPDATVSPDAALAAGTAPAAVPAISLDTVVALAAGLAPAVAPALSLAPAAGLAAGTAPAADPQISVTAQALALGTAPAPDAVAELTRPYASVTIA